MGDSGGQAARQSTCDDGSAEDGRTPDALARACAAQHRASTVGFDWDEPAGALEKVFEEAGEVAALVAGEATDGVAAGGGAGAGGVRGGAAERSVAAERAAAAEWAAARHAELGDLLFAVVNLARLADVDPADALDKATHKFEVRFREVERLAQARGLPMPGTALELLDQIWDEVKERERQG